MSRETAETEKFDDIEPEANEAKKHSLSDEASEALDQHIKTVPSRIEELEKASNAQPEALQRFFDFIRGMNLSADDLRDLNANFSIANGVWLKDRTGQSFAVHLADTLKTQLTKVTPMPGSEAEIPFLEEAPRLFAGVRVDGNPYNFLLENYGVWLQEGRRCLDRPMLESLDPKLLKAIQQRFTRGADPDMPPLSEIFPGKVEAARNRNMYMAHKGNIPQKNINAS